MTVRTQNSAGQTVERLAKRHGWKRVAILGAGDGEALRYLLGTCLRLEILLVEDWRQPETQPRLSDRLGPDDDGARIVEPKLLAQHKDRLERLANGHRDRLAVRPVPHLDAAELVDDGALDALVLLTEHRPPVIDALIEAFRFKLSPEARVVGLDWHIPRVTAWLHETHPGWTRHDKGVWSIAAATLVGQA